MCGYWCLLYSDSSCRGRNHVGRAVGKTKDLAFRCWLTRQIFILSAGALRKTLIPHCCAALQKNIFFFNLKQSCVYPQWAGRVVGEGLKKSWKQGWGEQNNKKAVAAEFRRLNSRAPITGTREQRHDVIRWKLFKYIYLFFPWNASTQTRIRINFIFQACTCKMRNLILLCLYPGVQWFGEKKEEKDNSRESRTIEKIKQNRASKK